MGARQNASGPRCLVNYFGNFARIEEVLAMASKPRNEDPTSLKGSYRGDASSEPLRHLEASESHTSV
jgi:hypothetical protein